MSCIFNVLGKIRCHCICIDVNRSVFSGFLIWCLQSRKCKHHSSLTGLLNHFKRIKNHPNTRRNSRMSHWLPVKPSEPLCNNTITISDRAGSHCFVLNMWWPGKSLEMGNFVLHVHFGYISFTNEVKQKCI